MLGRTLTAAAFSSVAIGYPALVYFGMRSLSPPIFSGALAALAASRFYFAKGRADAAQIALLVVVIA